MLQTEELPADHEPLTHAWHTPAEVAATADDMVPATQVVHCPAAGAEYDPAQQVSHRVLAKPEA
jgi:hypothetical protein